MEGSVSISIKTFDELRNAHEEAENKKQLLHRAAREIEVFLSFLVTRENISEFVDEFNKQSATSRINVEDGRAKIVMRDE
tara:strand:- start:583 stop:822 length:240 start_codon:yes stop_codon:yes gene_type:complete